MHKMHKRRLRAPLVFTDTPLYVAARVELLARPPLHEEGECMKALSSLRGVGLLLVAATAWGGLFPVAMVTLPVLDPFHMTAIRYGITAIIFVGLLALAEGPPALKMEGRGLRAALLGTAGFAGLGLLVFVGLQYSRPEHGAIIMA